MLLIVHLHDLVFRSRVFLVLVLVALGIFFGLDTAKQPERFVSIAGLVVNILFCWLFSRHPRKVRCEPFLHTSCTFLFSSPLLQFLISMFYVCYLDDLSVHSRLHCCLSDVEYSFLTHIEIQ